MRKTFSLVKKPIRKLILDTLKNQMTNEYHYPMDEKSIINSTQEDKSLMKYDTKLQLTTNNSKYKYLCCKCGCMEYKLGETRSGMLN